jgi:hypothetical protein
MADACHMYMGRFAFLVTQVRIPFTNHVGSCKGGDDKKQLRHLFLMVSLDNSYGRYI